VIPSGEGEAPAESHPACESSSKHDAPPALAQIIRLSNLAAGRPDHSNIRIALRLQRSLTIPPKGAWDP